MWKSTDFAWGEFTLSRRGPPPQTGLMTERKLRDLIDAGYGQGSLQRYKPWLRVTKRDFSTRGLMGHLPGISFARLHHFRSIAEKRTIQAAKWLGAIDVREAFPAWPWSHPHPAGELPGYEGMGDVPGLLDVARDAGIDHGTYVGTNIPYVATVDELTTWLSPSGHYRLVALENKPESITNAPDPTLRAKERLELIRRYCRQINVRHAVIDAHRLPRELCVNLDLLEPRLTSTQIGQVVQSALYADVLELLNVRGYECSADELLTIIERKRSAQPEMVNVAFHLALWRQDVDHDLTAPLRPWEPLIRGGMQVRSHLLEAWVGELA